MYFILFTANTTRTINITSNTTIDVPSSPPLPTPTPANGPRVSFEPAQSLHSQPSEPPPPPPPPPPPVEIDRERGTFTIRDKSGRARTIRIGKVVWPPPVEREKHHEIQVSIKEE